MSIHQKHISRLLQLTINRLNGFLYNLVLLQGKQIVIPFFYLYSRYINPSSYMALSCANSKKIVFGETRVNTTKNCIHFLCKNNWSNFALVGFA